MSSLLRIPAVLPSITQLTQQSPSRWRATTTVRSNAVPLAMRHLLTLPPALSMDPALVKYASMLLPGRAHR